MINEIFASNNLDSAKAMLDMTAARHQALAGNLANAHTPGYKRMDVSESFMERLNQAIRTRDVPTLQAIGRPEIEAASQALWPNQTEDGNNVMLEKEIMLMSQNQMAYEANAQFVSGSLRRLQSAITGRAS